MGGRGLSISKHLYLKDYAEFDSKILYIEFLHDYLLVCEISTVKTRALWFRFGRVGLTLIRVITGVPYIYFHVYMDENYQDCNLDDINFERGPDDAPCTQDKHCTIKQSVSHCCSLFSHCSMDQTLLST